MSIKKYSNDKLLIMGIRYLSKNVNIWKPDISVGDNR